MRTVVIGAAGSTCIILNTLIGLDCPPELVMSISENNAKNMSAYRPIKEIADRHNIAYMEFNNINDVSNITILKEIDPDYIFAVGFSQLVKEDILSIPKYGVIGFHPTALPKYRGRAAIVWQMLLGVKNAKVSMFMMDAGADSGDILGQEPYSIDEEDYAEDVLRKSDEALEHLAPRVIQGLKEKTLVAVPQNESDATYLLMRTPEDGIIDWLLPGKDIERLIHATSRPYPGAFSYYDGKQKAVFWKAKYVNDMRYIGFPGQIAYIGEDHVTVVCVDGLLEVTEFQFEETVKLRLGHKFKTHGGLV